MGAQIYRENYLAALEVAHSDLNSIFQECELLQIRRDQLQGALGALEPFLHSVQQSAPEIHQLEPSRVEQLHVEREPEFARPALHAAPEPVQVIPATFSPIPDAIMDPIQQRINRALGLAVA